MHIRWLHGLPLAPTGKTDLGPELARKNYLTRKAWKLSHRHHPGREDQKEHGGHGAEENPGSNTNNFSSPPTTQVTEVQTGRLDLGSLLYPCWGVHSSRPTPRDMLCRAKTQTVRRFEPYAAGCFTVPVEQGHGQ